MDMLLHHPYSDRQAGWNDLVASGIAIREPIGAEYIPMERWVEPHMPAPWLDEARAAQCNRPVSVFTATGTQQLLGFACYGVTARCFVGPIGVIDSAGGKGLGRALLLACLTGIRKMGYGYVIADYVGAADFFIFRHVAGTFEIRHSTPAPWGQAGEFRQRAGRLTAGRWGRSGGVRARPPRPRPAEMHAPRG